MIMDLRLSDNISVSIKKTGMRKHSRFFTAMFGTTDCP